MGVTLLDPYQYQKMGPFLPRVAGVTLKKPLKILKSFLPRLAGVTLDSFSCFQTDQHVLPRIAGVTQQINKALSLNMDFLPCIAGVTPDT